jgi:hypothetical protein
MSYYFSSYVYDKKKITFARDILGIHGKISSDDELKLNKALDSSNLFDRQYRSFATGIQSTPYYISFNDLREEIYPIELIMYTIPYDPIRLTPTVLKEYRRFLISIATLFFLTAAA